MLGCSEMIAVLRAHTLFDLLVSRPLRWLSGKSAELNDWSIYSMANAFDLVEQAMVRIAADGNVLLDPTFDIFKPIADSQPLFAKWRRETASEKITAPDGKTTYAKWAHALAEARTPQNAANAATTAKTVELAEVMAKAALLKFHDPKLALADTLTSQDGVNSIGKNAEAHAATVGAHTTNDTVESNFGCYDHVLRTFGVLTSVQAISGVAQQMRMHHFDVASTVAHSGRGDPQERQMGAFHSLPVEMQQSLVEWARLERKQSRKVEASDKAAQDEYRKFRREENLREQLEKVTDNYVTALQRFEAYMTPGRAMKREAVATELKRLAKTDGGRAGGQAPQKAFLREQIEMRVLGLGWTQFATKWSSTSDKRVGTVEHLQEHLEEILIHEKSQERLRRIPTEAAVPEMKRRTHRQLGTPACDAQELAAKAIFSVEEVRLAAEAEQHRRDDALIDDPVQRKQQKDAPLLDDSLVGKRLEINWRYYHTETRQPLLMWCWGEVVQVADGLSDKASERCRKLLPAGAVLMKWPADPDRKEKESLSWVVLLPSKWNKDGQNAWRFDPRDVPRPEAVQEGARANQSGSAKSSKRQRKA